MPEGMKSILQRARTSIFTRYFKMPSKLGEGPDKNHSYEQNIEAGKDMWLSTYFMPLEVEQPAALKYGANLIKAQTIGTVNSIVNKKRKVVLITMDGTTKDAESDIDKFFRQVEAYLKRSPASRSASALSQARKLTDMASRNLASARNEVKNTSVRITLYEQAVSYYEQARALMYKTGVRESIPSINLELRAARKELDRLKNENTPKTKLASGETITAQKKDALFIAGKFIYNGDRLLREARDMKDVVLYKKALEQFEKALELSQDAKQTNTVQQIIKEVKLEIEDLTSHAELRTVPTLASNSKIDINRYSTPGEKMQHIYVFLAYDVLKKTEVFREAYNTLRNENRIVVIAKDEKEKDAVIKNGFTEDKVDILIAGEDIKGVTIGQINAKMTLAKTRLSSEVALKNPNFIDLDMFARRLDRISDIDSRLAKDILDAV
jgi:tetratricopeptide (TPR) repeat protein